MTLVFLLGGAEGASRIVFAFHQPFERMRVRLTGDSVATFQKCIGQAYLLYAPLPGYTEDGHIEHNEEGFRGRSVPMRRTTGVARIVCLGGSTTYGWTSGDAEHAYPAQLETLLAPRLPTGTSRVEVINAGMPWETSAESFTHWHFKFHYFRPDALVLEAGGNDALAMDCQFYQPDYSHYRRQPSIPSPLPRSTRWITHSRFASLLIESFMYGASPERAMTFQQDPSEPPPARWYPDLGPLAPSDRRVPEDENAFIHNLEALIAEAHADHVRVLLFPFRPAPTNKYTAHALDMMAIHESLLRDLASRTGCDWAAFPVGTISEQNWVDDCHENAAGSAEKAAYLRPFVEKMLAP